jgi:hypothetical protein
VSFTQTIDPTIISENISSRPLPKPSRKNGSFSSPSTDSSATNIDFLFVVIEKKKSRQTNNPKIDGVQLVNWNGGFIGEGRSKNELVVNGG